MKLRRKFSLHINLLIAACLLIYTAEGQGISLPEIAKMDLYSRTALDSFMKRKNFGPVIDKGLNSSVVMNYRQDSLHDTIYRRKIKVVQETMLHKYIGYQSRSKTEYLEAVRYLNSSGFKMIGRMYSKDRSASLTVTYRLSNHVYSITVKPAHESLPETYFIAWRSYN